MMNRHLLPDEIDQILDGEAGFGTTPLKAHVRKCAACRGEIEKARALVSSLEHLPLHAPPPLFANRVMARVHVFVPWNVSLINSMQGWLPRSRPARIAATAGFATASVVLTIVALGIIARLEIAVFAVTLGLNRAGSAGIEALAGALGGGAGEPILQTMRSMGLWGLTIAFLLLTILAALAAKALRRITVGSR